MMMRERKNIAFGTAILVLALAFGVGANQWLTPGNSWAADTLQIAQQTATPQAEAPQTVISQTLVNEAAAAQVAQVTASQELLAQLYDQIAPSVVNIQVTENAEAQGLFPGQGGVIQGQGSGFIYDNDGHIVTNNHVAGNATSMTVYFSNGMWAPAELVAADPAADLAVIKVTPPEGVEWKPLTLAEPYSLRVGFTVVAFGSPFGLQETMTSGIVSALGRSVPTGSGLDNGSSYSLPDVIQTDTAINPGNSGGPLLDLKGEVVGVNFAINSTSGSNSGVGFAIPVSVVQKVVPALISDKAYNYSYLGIAGATINEQVAQEDNVPDNTLGVYVADVVQNGPSGKAGVKAGDVIVGIDDQQITHFEQLISYLFNNTAPGDTVTLHLLRDGKETTVDVKVESRPSASIAESNGGEAPAMKVTIAEAIRIATQAVQDAGLMDNVDGASAAVSTDNGNANWVVTLTSGNQTATVTVDGTTGEVLDLNVQ
jgi:2-alkenal reductase